MKNRIRLSGHDIDYLMMRARFLREDGYVVETPIYLGFWWWWRGYSIIMRREP